MQLFCVSTLLQKCLQLYIATVVLPSDPQKLCSRTQDHLQPCTPFHAKHRDGSCYSSKQCINSYKTGFKTAMHEFSVPQSKPHFEDDNA